MRHCNFWVEALLLTGVLSAHAVNYPIVDTGQTTCYDNNRVIRSPRAGQDFAGQDAQHQGNQPSYRDHGDGTISDLVTGLMWVKARGETMSWDQAAAGAKACRVGGHTDWRMPTIKELYSLINFTGQMGRTGRQSIAYLDTKYFDFVFGDAVGDGRRVLDVQDWSATKYRSTTMNGNETAFGVNFADGRIKGYPTNDRRLNLGRFVRYVRSNPSYGRNDFVDNGDGTVSDRATGLSWTQADSGRGMDWQAALALAAWANETNYCGHSDWRLPNAKELQSLVDYTRCPDVTRSAAIDPLFKVSTIDGGEYPYFWTSTTHLDGPPGHTMSRAVYVSFGRALGWMKFPPQFQWQLLDVHGAGAQRSDLKYGDASRLPRGLGPQGDVQRIDNHVRLVRGDSGPAQGQ